MIRIAAISYLNALPFIYGLKHHPVSERMDLHFGSPSAVAAMMARNEADLGLVPVAAVPDIPGCRVVSDYCIGAEKSVGSVLLCSGCSLEKISTLYIDTDSRTSVVLTKLLAGKFWNITPRFEPFDFALEQPDTDGSYIIIGDKALEYGSRFKFVYDLAEEWYRFRRKPFVFACWAANKELDPDFLQEFGRALAYGVNHIEDAVNESESVFPRPFVKNYLLHNISYRLDKDKKEGLQDFWTLALEELKSKVRW